MILSCWLALGVLSLISAVFHTLTFHTIGDLGSFLVRRSKMIQKSTYKADRVNSIILTKIKENRSAVVYFTGLKNVFVGIFRVTFLKCVKSWSDCEHIISSFMQIYGSFVS